MIGGDVLGELWNRVWNGEREWIGHLEVVNSDKWVSNLVTRERWRKNRKWSLKINETDKRCIHGLWNTMRSTAICVPCVRHCRLSTRNVWCIRNACWQDINTPGRRWPLLLLPFDCCCHYLSEALSLLLPFPFPFPYLYLYPCHYPHHYLSHYPCLCLYLYLCCVPDPYYDYVVLLRLSCVI